MKRILTGLALTGVLMVAAPATRIEAASLIGPASSAATQDAAEGLVINVRRGGGFRGGRMHFGGHRHFHGPRHIWRGPRVYLGGPAVVYPRRCRWVMTFDGPVRVCRRPPIWW